MQNVTCAGAKVGGGLKRQLACSFKCRLRNRVQPENTALNVCVKISQAQIHPLSGHFFSEQPQLQRIHNL